MRKRLPASVLVVPMAVAAAGCGHPSGGSEQLLGALLKGDAETAAFVARAPACAGEGGHRAAQPCLDSVATWLGAKTGFRAGLPDQPTAATAAVLALRGVGEAAPTPDAWIATMRDGSGPGADALRLAVASRMATASAPLGRALTTDADARALMKGVAASTPGTCEAYAALGAGGDPEDKSVPAQLRVDHAPCVQDDLARPAGPELHGRYGYGVWRGAEGALALWKTVAGALRAGVPKADGDARAAIDAKVSVIEGALAKVTTAKLAPTPGNDAADWAAPHGVPDAGVAPSANVRRAPP